MLKKLNKYFKLVKFSHTIFAMPFALIGFFLAYKDYETNFWIFIFIILCMVFVRNSAMSFNRLIDRDIDKKNQRTAKREIPTGIISKRNALLFVIINSVLFIVTTFFINRLVFFLSPVALFVVLFYSYTKRFTSLSHFILGLGLSLAPIGAYISVSNSFALLPIIFSVIVLLWVSGFDIIYAMQDYEFDKQEKLKSIPVLIGKKKSLILSAIIHFITAGLIIFVGLFFNFNYLFWIGAGIFILLLFYQHTIVKINDLSRVNLAFFTTNGIAIVIFGTLTIIDILVF